MTAAAQNIVSALDDIRTISEAGLSDLAQRRVKAATDEIAARLIPNAVDAASSVQPFEAVNALDIPASSAPQVVQHTLYGVTVLASVPNVGKSAFAVDMLAHVAADLPFMGRKVSGGPVVYIAAEAPYSIAQRVQATLRGKFASARLPYFVVRSTPRLGDENVARAHLDGVVAAILKIMVEERKQVRVVAIDTVAAVLAGADENGDGMQRLVSASQEIVLRTGAAVLLLHHPSKGDHDGLRGHSSLQGAADCIIRLTANDSTGVRCATVVKSRDGQTDGKFFFRLNPVTQPERDSFGDPVQTVMLSSEDEPARRIVATGKNQQAVIAELREFIRSNPDALAISTSELGSLFEKAGIARQRKPEVSNYLESAGILTPTPGGYLLSGKALP